MVERLSFLLMIGLTFLAAFAFSQEGNQGSLTLEADEVHYDGKAICLKGKVKIKQNQTLCLSTDHEVSIQQGTINGKKTICQIHSPKATHLSYIDAKSGQAHKMTAPGGAILDHEHQEIHLFSLPESSDISKEERQVYLEGLLGEVYADKAVLKYKWEKERMIPEKLTLENHICLKNRFSGHLQESGSILHYALADQVEYFPEKQEMLLSSQGENRVLFFDKVNHVQMSAASLKVQRDPLTNKDSIQGIGDVRFTFMEKELKEFKKHFHLGETSNK